jgi:hypothetical protein
MNLLSLRSMMSLETSLRTGLAFFMLLLSVTVDAQVKRPGGGAGLVGTWRGNSICVDKNHFPACQNEHVVYRIPNPPDTAGKVTISMGKIVEGKQEEMGVLDFSYDAAKRRLTNEFLLTTMHGMWEFTVGDTTMVGSLTVLPENLLARRVMLTKDSP